MIERNGKKFSDPSETPEEIVGLLGNIGNRPELRQVQERQIAEIKTLLKNQLTEIKNLVEKEIKPAVEYLSTANGNCVGCDPEVNHHTPECCIESGLSQLMWKLKDLERTYEIPAGRPGN